MKKDFIPFDRDEDDCDENPIPEDNLVQEHQPFNNQYKPISKDINGKARTIICPVK